MVSGIRAHRLTKRFEVRGGSLTAVDAVSFEVAPGEVFGLLGPNGAGKTTSLRMIMGLLEPDDGYAEVDGIRTGVDPSSTRLRQRLGMISTNDGVYPWSTAREMLLYFADLYAVDFSVAETRLKQLAEMLRLGEFLDQRCSTLSTGQRQRVILARGLMHDPPVMLLDEPTRGLDVVGSRMIFEFISHLRAQGKAVLLSTHRLDEAERLCDRFGLLNRGQLVHTGTLDQLRAATGQENLVDMFVALLADRPPATSQAWS